MAENSGVLVVAEAQEGKMAGITAEVIAAGKKVADQLGQPLWAVVLGSGIQGIGGEIATLGVSKVYVVDDALLATYQTDAYVNAMSLVCGEVAPAVLLFGQTQMARDLAPRLAFRLDTGYVPDCVQLDVESGSKTVRMTRPVYGGNAQATYVVEGKPQMASVRSKTHEPAAAGAGAPGEVVKLAVKLDPAALRAEVKEIVKRAAEGMRLEDAPAIVAGGRGIGSLENFKKLEDLAKALGGTIAGSRPAIDSGWIASDLQIGQTGKIVGPNIYFAVAISGAMQHMAGCLASKTIVAINRDPEAPVFKLAHFGVVADWQQVVPALTAKIKSL